MRQLAQTILLGSAAILLAAPSAAQPWDRDDRYRGYGGANVVQRALFNLERSRSYRYVDKHDRKHFEKARQDLFRFQENWRRGKFDKGRLNGAIGHIDHLVDSRQVHPRDRQILSRDLYDLRAFRSSGGYASGPGFYGSRRY